jgi:hypothetical protein
VSTVRTEDVSAHTAEILIDVISGNGITNRGVVFTTSSDREPEVGRSGHTSVRVSGTTGQRIVALENLSRDTTYYVRAYATNRHGTSYGETITFKTEAQSYVPNVSTVSAVGAAGSEIKVEINVRSDSGSNITERGVVYSRTNSNPKRNQSGVNIETISGRTGRDTVELTGLTSNTYYVRAFATNREGTAYGAVLFVNLGGSDNITTNSVTNITASTATAGGVAVTGQDLDIREHGVVYSATRSHLENLTSANSRTNPGNAAWEPGRRL